jgi:glyceraldehyde 3-phosphate dehydrogenase
MVVNGDRIKVLAERDPAKLPWGQLGVDVVLECTGLFTSKEKASAHLAGGAKKVIISAPGGKDVDATVVYGVNHNTLKASHTVISNASCTTNCLAPLVKPLHEKIGIVSGLMTTIHAYTNDQVLTDVYHEDLRRARSATMSMIPTKTGAAAAVGLVLPELNGKLDGYAMRVPTINVSLVDLTFTRSARRRSTRVNAHREGRGRGRAEGHPRYTKPLVSVDFNHDPRRRSSTDADQGLEGTLVKVCSWYDNEWGFSNRMLDTAVVRQREVMRRRRPVGRCLAGDDGERAGGGTARSRRRADSCGAPAAPRLFRRQLLTDIMAILRLTDLDVRGKRVLIREDLNVPVDGGPHHRATRASAPPADDPRGARAGARVMVMSHLGRPTEGVFDRGADLAGAGGGRLAELLGFRCRCARLARRRDVAPGPGRSCCCENVPLNKGEKKDDEALSKAHGGALRRLRDGRLRHGAPRRGHHARRGALRAGGLRRPAAGRRARRAGEGARHRPGRWWRSSPAPRSRPSSRS